MTHDGGKPHAVGYRGQPYVISVWDDETDGRITIGWRTKPLKHAERRALEQRPGWSSARCEPVANKATGEPPP